MCRQLQKPEITALLLMMATGVTMVGCGNVTAGGVGEAEVVVSGNGGQGEGSQGLRDQRPGARFSVAPLTPPSTPIEGSVTVELEVHLISEGGGSEGVSGGVRRVTVDIAGDVPHALGPVTLPEGSYGAVRIVFHEVEAQVLGGLEVGGIPIQGLVQVDFGESEAIEVERPISLLLVDGASLMLTVHLRSATWLELLDPLTLLVPAEGFSTSVEIEGSAALP